MPRLRGFAQCATLLLVLLPGMHWQRCQTLKDMRFTIRPSGTFRAPLEANQWIMSFWNTYAKLQFECDDVLENFGDGLVDVVRQVFA